MNISKPNIWLMFAANLVLATMAANSTMAEVTKKSDRAQEKNTRFLTRNETSTKAIDLIILPNQKNLVHSSLKSQIAQRDLDKFCQDYPYNSQCAGASPSDNSTPGVQTIPVPAPPPTSETETNDSNSSGQKTGWAIVPEISTLGFGGNIVRKITPAFNARVGVNAFGVGIDLNESQFDYDGDLNLFNVSSIIDVHPFKSSGFRISAGLIFGNNNIQGTADVSEQVADELGQVEVNGQTVNLSNLNINELATLNADVDINNSVSPYVGIGGGNPVREGKGLGFWWNAGVVFGGSPDVTVTPNIPNSVPEELRGEVQQAANTLVENEEQEIEDDLDFLSVYPVISLGISYQF